MFSIGEFASISRVTIRLLHHYDRIGLLKPARIDPSSGYRWYAPEQTRQLTRILELRDLGLRLDDVAAIVGGRLSTAEEEDLLQSARAGLARQIEQDTVRLERLDALLRSRAGEPITATVTAGLEKVAPQRIAYATSRAAGWGSVNISPVIGPLFADLASRLSASGVDGFGPAIATYQAIDSEQGDSGNRSDTDVRVTAAYVVDDTVPAGTDYQVMILPGLDQVASTTHRGSVTTIDQTWHGLLGWVEAHDLHPGGVCREVYYSPPDVPQEDWVTELQQPVLPAGRRC